MDRPQESHDEKKISWREQVSFLAGICGVLFGAVALVLSYQANETAREQASGQLAVLDMSGYNFTREEKPDLALNLWDCRFAIQVTNLGGSASSVVSYDAEFFFNGHEATVPGDGSPMIWGSTTELAPFAALEAFFSRSGKFDDIPTQDETRMQRLTEVVEPKSVMIFYLEGVVDSPTKTTSSFETFALDDVKSTEYDPTKLTGYTPVEIDFVFRTAEKAVIRSPRKPCVFVKP